MTVLATSAQEALAILSEDVWYYNEPYSQKVVPLFPSLRRGVLRQVQVCGAICLADAGQTPQARATFAAVVRITIAAANVADAASFLSGGTWFNSDQKQVTLVGHSPPFLRHQFLAGDACAAVGMG